MKIKIFRNEYDTGDWEKASIAYVIPDKMVELEVEKGLYFKDDIEDLIEMLQQVLSENEVVESN